MLTVLLEYIYTDARYVADCVIKVYLSPITELKCSIKDFFNDFLERIQDSEKGGHNYVNVSMAKYTIWHAKHAKSRGVWGHASQKI